MIPYYEHFRDVPATFEGPCRVDAKERIIWLKKLKFHRLDSPAIQWKNGRNQFFIEDYRLTEENYWNHPIVIKHKLTNILGL